MTYIVMDLEWNQPVPETQMIETPVKLNGEIIQIGAVKLGEDWNNMDTIRLMVRPKYLTIMNRQVAKVTGLTQSALKAGFDFPVAAEHFRKWCGEDFCFVTWGADDIPMLKDNLALHNLDQSWVRDFIDLQEIYDDQIIHENRRCGLAAAAEKLNAVMMTAHDALYDSMSTANVLRKLDFPRGVKEYRPHLKPWTEAYEQTEEDVVIYSSRDEAVTECMTATFRCPVCGQQGTLGEWAEQKTNTSVNLGVCPEGHEVFIRVRLRYNPRDNSCKAERIMFPADTDKKAFYQETLEKYHQEQEDWAYMAAAKTGDGMWSF